MKATVPDQLLQLRLTVCSSPKTRHRAGETLCGFLEINNISFYLDLSDIALYGHNREILHGFYAVTQGLGGYLLAMGVVGAGGQDDRLSCISVSDGKYVLPCQHRGITWYAVI